MVFAIRSFLRMGTSAWLWLFHFPRLRLLFHVHISNLFDEDILIASHQTMVELKLTISSNA
jgi:hypothetical protein